MSLKIEISDTHTSCFSEMSSPDEYTPEHFKVLSEAIYFLMSCSQAQLDSFIRLTDYLPPGSLFDELPGDWL
jgi:hypothetical protein